MARRPVLLRDAFVMVAAGGLLWFVAMGLGKSLLAEDEPSQAGKEGGQAEVVLSPAVESKLEQVMQNNEQILARFTRVIEEAQVLKVRVLRRPKNPGS